MARRTTAPETRLGLTPPRWVILLIVLVVAALELLPRLGILDSFTLPPISKIVIAGAELIVDPQFLAEDFAPTFSAILIAFVIASVLGVLLGVVLWQVRFLEEAFNPWLSIYYAIPTFALYPILVVITGVGLFPVVVLAILLAIVSVITATIDGLKATPALTLKLARSLELTPAQSLFKILLPSASRQIVVGLRLAVSFSIIGVMASEFILSTRGIGYFIRYSYDHFSISRMYGAILIVLVIAAGANLVFGALIERRERRILG